MIDEGFKAAIAEFDRIIAVPKSSVGLRFVSGKAVAKAEKLVKELMTLAYVSGDENKMETSQMIRRHREIITNTLALKYQKELEEQEQC